ncbi:hypothetical protein ACSLBF_17490 (plasmid) [Pseudoalteromonas sp. T1lg65]|uniref:hypothetical protein n=1 Tax=Pseudoalteromonas sp. T1lg65 TaxID=2077101 RepID=UPI003F78F3B4
MQQDQQVCDFGLHAGEPYRKLPASFLNWMVETNHEKCNLAKNELARRLEAVTAAATNGD